MPAEYPEIPGLKRPETFSHLARSGRWLFVAGQTAIDEDGQLVGVGDIEAQAHQVHRNIQRVLAAAGASLEDVVQLTTYVTDMRFRAVVGAVRVQYFHPPLPPNTLLGVTALADERLLLEISVIAVLPSTL